MTSEQIVRAFFEEVRSGRSLERANIWMAEQVYAHQVVSEAEETVIRTPQQYADHVREMMAAYGPFSLEVQECIAQEDKVFVRWKQVGSHIGEVDGFAPTGLPVIEIASAVYRVEAGKIVEYWIQIDRSGIRVQLERNQRMNRS
ncbi:ester cyclase [Paenibacillus chibensis]|uniref:ester cyclase n=1 Tax=Paenibacillus chibensis TaxID=59846 RepID=UPI000FD861E1|nr:ester cyclase [Paenibacillus chibensis]MEC0372739.1 ester cyclase [Paenibacillus chibensis]